MPDFLLFAMIFLFGVACGGMFEKFLQSICRNPKVRTPSTSHNSAMVEICPSCNGEKSVPSSVNQDCYVACPTCSGAGKLRVGA